MIRPAAALLALAALAACETTPPATISMSEEGMQRAAAMPPEALVPDVSTQVTLQAFESYCRRFPANPAGTRRAALANGYFLLASMTRDGLEMYAKEGNNPLVATGSRDGADVCMVMVQRDPALGRAVGPFVQARYPGAQPFGSMQFGGDTAENIWIVPNTPPVLFFTLVEDDPFMGPIEALAMVTE